MTVEEMEAMGPREVSIEAILPESINTFEYTKNHHYIRLSKKEGAALKLIPSDQMLYVCPGGCMDFLTNSNHGTLRCPVCGAKMKSGWGRKQVCFIPERESDFEFPKKA